MDLYLKLLAGGTILIACIVLFLWLVLRKFTNKKLNMRDALLTSEELEKHAKNTAIEHSVSRRQNFLHWPVPRMNENYEFILSVYKELNEDIQKKYNVPPAAEWLLDNFYLIEEQVKELRRDLIKSNYLKLPVLRFGRLKGYARIFAVAVELVAHTDGLIDEKVLLDYLKAYQSHNVLFDREIWAIPLVIKLALIENIRHLCGNLKYTQMQWHKADEIFYEWQSYKNEDTGRIIKLFKSSMELLNEASWSFIEHLLYRLRRSGRSYVEILRVMDEELIKRGVTTEEITQKEHNFQSINTVSLGNSITSLRYVSTLNWDDFFESASMVDQILRQDPDGTYMEMDIATRNYYKSKVEEMASIYGVSQLYIAKEAVDLAKQACLNGASPDDVKLRRTWHVGYYLIGNGVKLLGKRQKKSNRRPKAARPGKISSYILYLGSIGLITLLLTALAVQYSIFTAESDVVLLSVLAGLCVLIPASEIAVHTVNWIVCKALKPAVFPRMELRDGIPEDMSTIVVVPTLLPDEERVKELLNNLEGHYLSNREDNLYFALLGAFGDSDKPNGKNDEKIIDAALKGIQELNKKYSGEGCDKFYFFHRTSQFNEKNNKWFGWERKRGALMEFNDMLLGRTDTSIVYSSCSNPPFSSVKYIITLDSDTILPMGMAKKMIGAMAHPLNRPVVDEERGIVVEGYGLMQPRIDIEIESSNRSVFSRIFTGQKGIDPYANAISDVYQDLFGEGIFTGKGIYDLKVFESVLKGAIPENLILSHDLLEGSYVRTGLVTDLILVDSYPSRYNSYTSRLHRWVRGDWQLLPMMGRKIRNGCGKKISNPISLLSRWKMLDNLRRSLVAPSLMIMGILSFSILPGSIYFWLGYFLVVQAFPFMTATCKSVFSRRQNSCRVKPYVPVMMGAKAMFLQGLLAVTFLPYQAWLMIHAIVITLCRLYITKKNLLEWVTSADVEKFQKNSLRSYLSKMKASLLEAPILLILAIIFKGVSGVAIGMFFLLLWGSGPLIAYGISKNLNESVWKASEKELSELRRIARKTWRYFEEFTNAKGHYLAPDNYQADPPKGIAYRTSPTNIGFGLLAILTARDFGYIGTSEMINLIDKTVSTMEKLEKWNGHLYNWYHTYTLKPMRPAYISTVDSGNLASYLITLRQGLLDYLRNPLADARFLEGIRDTLFCAGKDGVKSYELICSLYSKTEKDPLDLGLWIRALEDLMTGSWFDNIKKTVWKNKMERMIQMFHKEMSELMPGAGFLNKIPEGLQKIDSKDDIGAAIEELIALLKKNQNLQDLPKAHREAIDYIERIIDSLQSTGTEPGIEESTWLYELKTALEKSIQTSEQLIERYRTLIERIDALSEAMKFEPLYDKKKQLFSIGFNPEENKLSNSYYDLLASEARQTSYLCIARGEITPNHWFRMGRSLTVVDGYKGLISWTGTMFEYLMPLLIMKSYRNTLLDETYSFVIKSQIKYGNQRRMPWGTSESGFNTMDINHEYQYKAIGVPWLGFKRGLIEDAVAAPYATFLALLVDPESAVRNIMRLKEEGLEGSYGFYEAADYTPERLPFEVKRSIVKSFMAHHQGMSFLALNNYINDNIMQKRFHSDPAIHAARLLLHEKVPANLVVTKDNKEKVIPLKENPVKEQSLVRRFSEPDPILPKVHILSNGNYSVMITDRGTGYSKSKMMAVTRWRSDSTLDSYGMFFYLRNLEKNTVWSTTYAPFNTIPDQYEVVFTADKAVFRRMDGDIETKMEVAVASGDSVEIRRLTLKNFGEEPCTIELTSYFEIVLNAQAADEAHPAFSNLFVETEYHPERKCILASRRPRSETDKSAWLANAVVLKEDTLGDIQFETDRVQLIGRGHGVKNPIAMEKGKPLSNTSGPVLDPVMSIRVKVKIEPGMDAGISFVTAVGESNESMLSMIDNYGSPDAVEGAFQLAFARSQVETKYLNLDNREMELYQDMLSDILFISPVRRRYQDFILNNRKGQSSLWQYGISGDLPIVLVVLKKAHQVEILNEVLKAHEYWRLMDLKVDLILLSEEEHDYGHPLYQLISDIVLSNQTHDVFGRPRDIFILDRNRLQEQDLYLLYAVARIILTGDGGTMKEQVSVRQKPQLPEPKQFVEKAMEFPPYDIQEPERIFFNGLGGFSADGREYIIQLEKGQNTPAPWINVIANSKFGFLVSESGSGHTWYENSRENKLTPWSNDAVTDSPGEVIYIGDEDTGKHWTVTPLPVREEESYLIRHGFGYSIFEHASHGLIQRLSYHVPMDESVKICILSLENSSDLTRNLTLTYYIRPVLGVSDQVTAMHIKTSISESGTFMVENPYNEEFPGRICFIEASARPSSFTGDRKEFFGFGDMSSPECLLREGLSGAVGTGLDPCAAIQIKITLEPKETREMVFLLGMTDTLQEVDRITKKYGNIKNAKDSLSESQKFWKEKMSILQVDTPDVSMNLMLNGWLPYQILSCRIWARSAFYQSGGAFGFRDQLQDCLSIVNLYPELARKQILLHARHQFIQGDVQHWWHEPLGKGTRTRISDDLLWLPFVTSEYIRITGDHRILDEEIPFLEDAVLAEGEEERYGRPGVSDTISSLYDHCVRTIEICLRFGEHGLPLMGTGDWNDGMNTVGNRGLGESVWMGWFLITVLEKFAPVCMEMGEEDRAKKYSEIRSDLLDAVETSGWDGNWYRRAYFDNGQPLGSVHNSDCKIDSIAQSWAVISGAGDKQRSVQAMNSLEDYLVRREEGLIKLLTPPFDKGDLEPGYIKGYIPGVRENGGQYTHAAAWAIIAFAKLGEGDKARELFELINPIHHTDNYREYSRYKVEPYVMAADVYTSYPHAGRGGWSWYTGSAGWMYRAGIEYILGFQKNRDTIVLDPCIPKKWKEYTMKYKYLDTLYEIKINNMDGVNQGVKEVSVDGEISLGNQFTLVNDGKTHQVEIFMGI